MLSLARWPPVYMETVLRKWTKTPSRHSCRLYRAVVLDDTEACFKTTEALSHSSGPLTPHTQSSYTSQHKERSHSTVNSWGLLYSQHAVNISLLRQASLYNCSLNFSAWMTVQLIEKRWDYLPKWSNLWFLLAVDNKMGWIGSKARPEHSRDQISSRFEGGLFLLWPVSNLATT